MRPTIPHATPGAAVALALLAAVVPARADDLSSDAIVRALRPTSTDGATRGIRPIAPDHLSAMQGPLVAPGVRQVASKPPAVSLNVDFASGSDALRPDAMRTLDALGRALTGPELSAYKFRIDGHTDTVGADDMNKALSERRAEAVARYLSERFQVPSERMEVVGSGKQGLAVPTGDEVDEPRNRRVEVVNLGS
jgi:outer membrane protein OmpA-like peptidoglycan-associated protein